MFFIDERSHFFRPLSSKYREQVAQCLRLLYQRQFSSTADYGQSLSREQIVELLEEALVRSANQVLDSEVGEQEQRFKNHREHANWVLKQLLECGWVDRQVDSATLQSSFPFTRMGRAFSQALVESDSTQIRTRHRNTRNTLNALEAFLNRGEVYDLLDAFDYSERIITDFTDVISELEERKRELVREVEAQQLVHQASDQFFDFMEKRFQPDISVRLSADSVEKHREDIAKVIAKIRRKQKEFKHKAERELRRSAPDLCASDQSYLWHILDSIEQRLRNASEVMLPALRNALHGFTKRADIIIRQLSYLSNHADNDLVEVCKELVDLDEAEYARRTAAAASVMSGIKLQLIDPAFIKLQDRKYREGVDSIIRDDHQLDDGAQREILAQQQLDQAFVINNENIQAYLKSALDQHDGKIGHLSTADLKVTSASDLLALAHIVEVAAVNNVTHAIKIRLEPTGQQIKQSDYYQLSDEFLLYIESESQSEKNSG